MAFYVFLDTEADTGSSVLQVCTMAATYPSSCTEVRGTEILGRGYPRAGFSVGFSLVA